MIEVLLIIFSIALLALSLTTMVDSYVRNLIYQAIVIFFITLFTHEAKNLATLIFILLETIFIKGILVPYILFRNIKENEIVRELEPNTPQYLSILIMSLILIFGFVIAFWFNKHIKEVNSMQFGISISTILAGLFLILARKQLITHVIGYMVIENGTFLLSLSVIKNLPSLVALGISLDILMGILLAGILINHIKTEFNEEEGIDSLTSLKD
jgi:hydrogenase-4 component E